MDWRIFLAGIFCIVVDVLLWLFALKAINNSKIKKLNSDVCKGKRNCPTPWHTFGTVIVVIIMIILAVLGVGGIGVGISTK